MPAKTKRPLRTTPNMLWVLASICAGKDTLHGCNGRSEHAARGQTLIALRDRGLLDEHDQPTEAGKALAARA